MAPYTQLWAFQREVGGAHYVVSAMGGQDEYSVRVRSQLLGSVSAVINDKMNTAAALDDESFVVTYSDCRKRCTRQGIDLDAPSSTLGEPLLTASDLRALVTFGSEGTVALRYGIGNSVMPSKMEDFLDSKHLEQDESSLAASVADQRSKTDPVAIMDKLRAKLVRVQLNGVTSNDFASLSSHLQSEAVSSLRDIDSASFDRLRELVAGGAISRKSSQAANDTRLLSALSLLAKLRRAAPLWLAVRDEREKMQRQEREVKMTRKPTAVAPSGQSEACDVARLLLLSEALAAPALRSHCLRFIGSHTNLSDFLMRWQRPDQGHCIVSDASAAMLGSPAAAARPQRMKSVPVTRAAASSSHDRDGASDVTVSCKPVPAPGTLAHIAEMSLNITRGSTVSPPPRPKPTGGSPIMSPVPQAPPLAEEPQFSYVTNDRPNLSSSPIASRTASSPSRSPRASGRYPQHHARAGSPHRDGNNGYGYADIASKAAEAEAADSSLNASAPSYSRPTESSLRRSPPKQRPNSASDDHAMGGGDLFPLPGGERAPPLFDDSELESITTAQQQLEQLELQEQLHLEDEQGRHGGVSDVFVQHNASMERARSNLSLNASNRDSENVNGTSESRSRPGGVDSERGRTRVRSRQSSSPSDGRPSYLRPTQSSLNRSVSPPTSPKPEPASPSGIVNREHSRDLEVDFQVDISMDHDGPSHRDGAVAVDDGTAVHHMHNDGDVSYNSMGSRYDDDLYATDPCTDLSDISFEDDYNDNRRTHHANIRHGTTSASSHSGQRVSHQDFGSSHDRDKRSIRPRLRHAANRDINVNNSNTTTRTRPQSAARLGASTKGSRSQADHVGDRGNGKRPVSASSSANASTTTSVNRSSSQVLTSYLSDGDEVVNQIKREIYAARAAQIAKAEREKKEAAAAEEANRKKRCQENLKRLNQERRVTLAAQAQRAAARKADVQLRKIEAEVNTAEVQATEAAVERERRLRFYTEAELDAQARAAQRAADVRRRNAVKKAQQEEAVKKARFAARDARLAEFKVRKGIVSDGPGAEVDNRPLKPTSSVRPGGASGGWIGSGMRYESTGARRAYDTSGDPGRDGQHSDDKADSPMFATDASESEREHPHGDHGDWTTRPGSHRGRRDASGARGDRSGDRGISESDHHSGDSLSPTPAINGNGSSQSAIQGRLSQSVHFASPVAAMAPSPVIKEPSSASPGPRRKRVRSVPKSAIRQDTIRRSPSRRHAHWHGSDDISDGADDGTSASGGVGSNASDGDSNVDSDANARRNGGVTTDSASASTAHASAPRRKVTSPLPPTNANGVVPLSTLASRAVGGIGDSNAANSLLAAAANMGLLNADDIECIDDENLRREIMLARSSSSPSRKTDTMPTPTSSKNLSPSSTGSTRANGNAARSSESVWSTVAQSSGPVTSAVPASISESASVTSVTPSKKSKPTTAVAARSQKKAVSSGNINEHCHVKQSKTPTRPAPVPRSAVVAPPSRWATADAAEWSRSPENSVGPSDDNVVKKDSTTDNRDAIASDMNASPCMSHCTPRAHNRARATPTQSPGSVSKPKVSRVDQRVAAAKLELTSPDGRRGGASTGGASTGGASTGGASTGGASTERVRSQDGNDTVISTSLDTYAPVGDGDGVNEEDAALLDAVESEILGSAIKHANDTLELSGSRIGKMAMC